MLVSPAERHPSLRALGRTSSIPERYGADFLWAGRCGSIGVQRKEFPGDFLSSVSDGRLAKEIGQLQALDLRVLMLEGDGSWTVDGNLVSSWGQAWTREQHRKFLWSVQKAGVWVERTADVEDTVRAIRWLVEWGWKSKHQSVMRRPSAKGGWGKPSSRELGVHVLQSFEGIGPEVAERIWEHFGGLPLAWTVTVEEMMGVKGVGVKRARKLVEVLGGVAA